MFDVAESLHSLLGLRRGQTKASVLSSAPLMIRWTSETETIRFQKENKKGRKLVLINKFIQPIYPEKGGKKAQIRVRPERNGTDHTSKKCSLKVHPTPEDFHAAGTWWQVRSHGVLFQRSSSAYPECRTSSIQIIQRHRS